MKLKLEAKQTLAMTGKMLQSIELLQMPVMDLRNYIYEMSLENPVIELSGEDSTWDIASTSSGLNEGTGQIPNKTSRDTALLEQLLGKQYEDKELEALQYMITALDHHGYFVDSIKDIGSEFGFTAAEVRRFLGIIQAMEPAGIGARNLEESLLLQLTRLKQDTRVAQTIVHKYFEEFSKNKLKQIAEAMGLPLETVAEGCKLIKSLSPAPGAALEEETVEYTIPDAFLEEREGKWQVVLNEKLYPDVEINSYYAHLNEEDKNELHSYLQKKLEQAYWLKECIEKRNKTLLKVIEAVLFFQKAFLLEQGALRPLGLKELAERVEMHESTVSRALHDKYLQSPRGVFPLNYFLVKSVKQEREAVSEEEKASATGSVTVETIKRALKALIATENKAKPLSDEKLRLALAQQGMELSRRTVAKYREQENIPAATGRKEF